MLPSTGTTQRPGLPRGPGGFLPFQGLAPDARQLGDVSCDRAQEPVQAEEVTASEGVLFPSSTLQPS